MILERNTPSFDANAVAAQVAMNANAAMLAPWRMGARVATWLGVGVLVLAGVLAVLRSTWWTQTFGIQSIVLSGDTQYHSESGVLAHLQTKLGVHVLRQHYWTIDLGAVQAALETLPWVKSAQVQRVFPNKLNVRLSAHTAAARWEGSLPTNTETGAWMVSNSGVVFDASGGEAEGDALPLLRGKPGEAADLLKTLHALNGKLMAKSTNFAQHTLSRDALGLWQSSGAQQRLELGSGSAQDVLARVDQLTQSWDAIAHKFESRTWAVLDLRHKGGLALAVSGLRMSAQAQSKNTKNSAKDKTNTNTKKKT